MRAILRESFQTPESSSNADLRVSDGKVLVFYERDSRLSLTDLTGLTPISTTIYATATGSGAATLVTDARGGIVVFSNYPKDVFILPAGATSLVPSAFVADQTNRPISVTDFGAVGEGTTDDTLKIQAAINALTDGDTLYFPPGLTFKTTDALTFSNLDHIRIEGTGRIKQTTALKNGFTLVGCTYVDIEGLALEGPNSTPTQAGLAEFIIQADETSSHITISGIYAEKWGGHGIRSLAPSTVVRNCRLIGQNPSAYETAHSAVLLLGSDSVCDDNWLYKWSVGVHSSTLSGHTEPTDQQIVNNRITCPTSVGTSAENLGIVGGGNRAGVYAASGKYTLIDGNNIKAVSTFAYGIKIGFGAYSPIIGNNIVNGSVIAVGYSFGALVHDNTVIGASITVSYEDPDFMPEGFVVDDNTIQNTPHDSASAGAILIRAKNGIVSHNNIQNCQNHGISLAHPLIGQIAYSDIQLLDNQFSGVGLQADNTYSPIKLGSGTEYFPGLVIRGNKSSYSGSGYQAKYGIDGTQASALNASTITEGLNDWDGWLTARSAYGSALVTMQTMYIGSPLALERGLTLRGQTTYFPDQSAQSSIADDARKRISDTIYAIGSVTIVCEYNGDSATFNLKGANGSALRSGDGTLWAATATGAAGSGTDTKANVYLDSTDHRYYIENRLGAASVFACFMFGTGAGGSF